MSGQGASNVLPPPGRAGSGRCSLIRAGNRSPADETVTVDGDNEGAGRRLLNTFPAHRPGNSGGGGRRGRHDHSDVRSVAEQCIPRLRPGPPQPG